MIGGFDYQFRVMNQILKKNEKQLNNTDIC